MLSQVTTLLGLNPAPRAADTQKGEEPKIDFASVFAKAEDDAAPRDPEHGQDVTSIGLEKPDEGDEPEALDLAEEAEQDDNDHLMVSDLPDPVFEGDVPRQSGVSPVLKVADSSEQTPVSNAFHAERKDAIPPDSLDFVVDKETLDANKMQSVLMKGKVEAEYADQQKKLAIQNKTEIFTEKQANLRSVVSENQNPENKIVAKTGASTGFRELPIFRLGQENIALKTRQEAVGSTSMGTLTAASLSGAGPDSIPVSIDSSKAGGPAFGSSSSKPNSPASPLRTGVVPAQRIDSNSATVSVKDQDLGSQPSMQLPEYGVAGSMRPMANLENALAASGPLETDLSNGLQTVRNLGATPLLDAQRTPEATPAGNEPRPTTVPTDEIHKVTTTRFVPLQQQLNSTIAVTKMEPDAASGVAASFGKSPALTAPVEPSEASVAKTTSASQVLDFQISKTDAAGEPVLDDTKSAFRIEGIRNLYDSISPAQSKPITATAAPVQSGPIGGARVTSPLLADFLDEQQFAEASSVAVTSEARISTPKGLAPSPAVHRTDAFPMLRQVADGMARLSDGTVDIRLSPEELGQVRMQLVTSDTGMTVHVSADRPETLDLMRRNIDQLARDLADAGYDGASFTFSGGDADQRGDHKRTDPNRVASDTTDQQVTQDPVAITATEGLDVRI